MSPEIINFIKTVPDVIWSAIIASGIALFGVVVASSVTLFGVMISNKSNTNRLVRELDHDTSEKSKENISHLRREVYLKAVEDIEIASIQLSTLANRELTKLDMTLELQAIVASMAKLKLVAEPETTRLAGELSTEFGVLFLKLLPRLVIVQGAKADIEINNSCYDSSLAEASRIQRDMKKFNEEGRQDWVIYQTLKSSYEFHFDQSQEHAAARARAHEVHGGKLHEFNVWLLPEMKELSRFQLKVMVAIRKDLGIACDVADMRRQLERHWAIMEAGYGDVMRDLKPE